MKIAFALLILLASAQGALSAGANCRAIEGKSERLTCYDVAFPPKIQKPEVIGNEPSRSPYKDPFVAEEAQTNAKLKGICRGC